jgi:regulator of protease activity HflC (stomatin/prohibitin superfamily)
VKKLMMILMVAIASLLTGCGFVETGNVGVRTAFGQVESQEIQPGFYTAFFSHVDQFTVKETFVALENMTPRAKDNLTLKDLDVTVYYKMAPGKVADFAVGHAGMSVKAVGENFARPGYVLLENIARGVIYDEASKFDSLTMHQNRQGLESAITKSLVEALGKSDPGYFEITRVIIRSIQTDPQVEESIRKAVAKDKELEAAQKDVQVKQQMADANERLAHSLSPAFLQHEYIGALNECAKNQHCTMIVGGSSTPLLNITK